MDSHQRQNRVLARLREWRFAVLVVAGGTILAACSSDKATGGNSPDVPSALSAVSATTQSGVIGQAVGIKPSVRVVDDNGVGIEGVAVTFASIVGGGTVTGATQVTAANGIATVGNWTLGATAGTNILEASADTIPGSAAIFGVAAGATASNFTIQLQYINAATEAQQIAFVSAAARWSEIITGDLGAINVTPPADVHVCGAPSGTTVSGPVNDLKIVVELKPYDGVGQVLGAATPCYTRNGGRQLPLIGYMFFDTADLANLQAAGDLNDVILHEMGHVLGFGTYWEPPAPNNLLQVSDISTGSTVGFNGPNAVAAYTGSNGGSGTTVPVEDNGIEGTERSHWKEDVFKSELMTGYISGNVRPLSLTTVQSMADLGYTVNPAAADAFNLATQPTLRAGDDTRPTFQLKNDIIRVPRRYIDEATGRVVPGPTR
jgi:Leishmanolysin